MKSFSIFIILALASVLNAEAQLSWTTRQQGNSASPTLWGVGKGPAGVIAVGASGVVLQSIDGVNWTPRPVPASAWLLSVTYGNGHYVAVGDAGLILVSVDGSVWNQVGGGVTSQRLNRVIFGHNKFVAVGELQTVLYSSDGITWTQEPTLVPTGGAAVDVNALGWLRGLATNFPFDTDQSGFPSGNSVFTAPEIWVTGGQYGVVLTSVDGQHWIKPDGPFQAYNIKGENNTLALLDIENITYSGDHTSPGIVAGVQNSIVSDDEVFSLVGQSMDDWDLDDHFQINPTPAPTGVLSYNSENPLVQPNIRFRAFAAYDLQNVLVDPDIPPVPLSIAAGDGGAIYPSGINGPFANLPTSTGIKDAIFYNNSYILVGDQETIFQSAPVSAPVLANISSRGFVGTGEQVMIAGTIITGSQPRKMLIRGLGPTLTDYNVSNVLADPQIQVYDQKGNQIAKVGAWATSPDAQAVTDALQQLGAAPLRPDRLDSALVLSLPPGGYTFIVSSVSGQTGIALVDAFDLNAGADTTGKLVNVSTRAFVGPGEKTLIAGLIIDGVIPKRILLRGIGPLLAISGIAQPLDNPVITVFDSGGHVMTTNDDWGTVTTNDYVFNHPVTAQETSTLMKSIGVTSLDNSPREAALVVKLKPGAYTVQVTSKTGQTGTALVEAYELPY